MQLTNKMGRKNYPNYLQLKIKMRCAGPFFLIISSITGVSGSAYAHHNKSLNLIFFCNFHCLLIFENVFSSSFFHVFFFILTVSGSVYTHHNFFLTHIYIFYNRGRLHVSRIILWHYFIFFQLISFFYN